MENDMEKGFEIQDLKEKALNYMWQFGTSRKKMINRNGPTIFSRGEGCYLFDIDDNRYLDGLAGVWVVNAGHGQPSIIQAVHEQQKSLSYALTEEGYSNCRAVELAEKLCNKIPGEMKRVYFTCGGSEAVEIALRFSRMYHNAVGKPGKYKIVSREGSYHGGTLFAMSVSPSFDMFSQSVGPLPKGAARTVHPYCCRCDRNPDQCSCQCADDLERVIREEGPETVAAFIAEPISTASGVAIPPVEYWKKIRSICNKYDVLLIADEIVTGFGRTGKFTGMEHFGVVPDITTFAKGLTSGYVPMGAVVMNKKVTNGIPDYMFLIPGFTYSGHPVSCAAAVANIDFILEEGLVNNSNNMGKYLLERLKDELSTHPFIGDIRGEGLLICIELKNMGFPLNTEISSSLESYYLKAGLYLRLIEGYVHLGPPLIINREEVDKLVNIVVSGIEHMSGEYSEIMKIGRQV